MNAALYSHLRQTFGPDQVIDSSTGTTLRPASLDALAAMLGEASREGWPIAVSGTGSWQPADRGAALTLSTTALDTLGACHPEDLHVSAAGGVRWSALQEHTARSGTCIALDPPGAPTRTLGSILATGTAGGLQHGFGPVRDQVLGLTVVTGAGEILRTGGTTVKNVAGFDLMKLHLGAFGAYGVLAEGTLRLRTRPTVDQTIRCSVPLTDLWAARPVLTDLLHEAAAVDLVVHSDNAAHLVVRWQGAAPVVSAHREALRRVLPGPWEATPEQFGATTPTMTREAPVAFRLGVLPSLHERISDLLGEHLPGGIMHLGVLSGLVRWQGDASPSAIQALRIVLAELAIPLTIERAPHEMLHHIGRFAVPEPGLTPILAHLRRTFDPAGILRAGRLMVSTP